VYNSGVLAMSLETNNLVHKQWSTNKGPNWREVAASKSILGPLFVGTIQLVVSKMAMNDYPTMEQGLHQWLE
jgi:hypothetical protein